MIKGYVFDMGGTLEDIRHDPDTNRATGERILSYLDTHGIRIAMEPEQFVMHVEQQAVKYRAWSMDELRELTPYEIWSQWYLKDFEMDQTRLRIIADNVANLWERGYYTRAIRPDAANMLQGLRDRGFSLGVISNTGCQTQVIEILHEYGIHQHFSTIYLSALSGHRKPHTGLFWAAAADLGLAPEECAYVGDTVSRDVRGSRAAGFGACIRIDSHLTRLSDAQYVDGSEDADYVVESLNDILSLDIAQGEQVAV